MNTVEIVTLIFAAVAAVSAVVSLVVLLRRRRQTQSDGGANDNLREDGIRREIEYARKSIIETGVQSNENIYKMFGAYLDNSEKQTGAFTDRMQEAMNRLLETTDVNAAKTDEKLARNLDAVRADFKSGVTEMRTDTGAQLTAIRKELTENVDRMRSDMQARLKDVREDNEKQLDKMRATVEEKLSETLDKRVQDAFRQVSDRLDSVQKGFGEMKELTANVGNLNRIFSNVKTRGNWGEVSLQSLLEQILAPEQYRMQFQMPRSREAVDFAIVMPGQAGEEVYLPIDAKFPLEDYYRLLEAGENGDKTAVEMARKALRERVKTEARSINEKYIKVPVTTNFAVLYVPNEGLYAEILRDGSFASDLQTKYRVTVCGPTTVSALLNSLQVGFTTLKIQKKSGEIIKLMQAVRADFGKFTALIDKIKDRAQGVVNVVDDIEKRNRIITRKLEKLGDDMPEQALAEGGGAALSDSSEGEE